MGVKGLAASSNALPSTLLAADQTGGLSELGWSSYQTIGDMIATQVISDPTLKANFLKCDASAPTCLHDTAVEFGRRAFRRPLTTAEVTAFDGLIAKGAQVTPTAHV